MVDTIGSDLWNSLITSTKTLFPDNKVIRGRNAGTEPPNPYVSLNIISENQVGLASQSSLLNLTSEISTLVNYEVVVQFSFVSTNEDAALDLAKTFIQYLNTSPTREVFRRNSLSKQRSSPMRNLSYKRETVWTQQFNVDVTFAYSSLTKQRMAPITTVQLTDELSGEVFTVPPDVVIDPNP